ncbi:MAG: glucose-6-phosphate isomerase, partial [Halobacteriaceae archaeon]
MKIDIGNALADVADPGVPRGDLEDLNERVSEGHERIQDGRDANEYGYRALNLPDQVDIDEIREVTGPFDPGAIIVIGIGGSGLGASTLAALSEDSTTVHVLDNIDPKDIKSRLDAIPLSDAIIHVVSRSGSTAETLANFLVVREAFTKAGIDWTDRTFITTGQEGNLRRLADENGLPVLDAPPGVPGRFSVLSTVALPTATLLDLDVERLLAGAREVATSLSNSLFETPPYAYGAMAYALDQRGATMNAFLPYSESLEPLAEWFAQLWAESLGKDGRGQTPLRALGVTDQHSQLQLYRSGPRDKFITLLRPQNRPIVNIPTPNHADLNFLADEDLGSLMDAEFRATEASLAAVSRPNVRIEVDTIDERCLGQLLYGFEAACIMAGELYEVNAFNQPAV